MNTQQLRDLLDAGLAIMAENDPARINLTARLSILADRSTAVVSLSFYDYSVTPVRECYGGGNTTESALEDFKTNYKAPKSPAERAAELRAEADRLESGQ